MKLKSQSVHSKIIFNFFWPIKIEVTQYSFLYFAMNVIGIWLHKQYHINIQWEIYILNVLWLNGHSILTRFCHSCCCRGALCFWGQKWTDTVCFAQTSPGYNHRDLLLRLLVIPWLGHFTSCHSHRTHVFRDIPTPRVEGDRPSKMYLVTHYSILHYSILHSIRISSTVRYGRS